MQSFAIEVCPNDKPQLWDMNLCNLAVHMKTPAGLLSSLWTKTFSGMLWPRLGEHSEWLTSLAEYVTILEVCYIYHIYHH